jgi:hypothetical protein
MQNLAFEVLCACGNFRVRVGARTQESAYRRTQDRKYFGRVVANANLLDFDSLDQHFDKLDQNVCIEQSLMQNLLHFDAPVQNPLDLIGFPVVGSCRTLPLACIRPPIVVRIRLLNTFSALAIL